MEELREAMASAKGDCESIREYERRVRQPHRQGIDGQRVAVDKNHDLKQSASCGTDRQKKTALHVISAEDEGPSWKGEDSKSGVRNIKRKQGKEDSSAQLQKHKKARPKASAP